MKKIINYCGNCHFFHTEYDDYSLGNGQKNICVLFKNLKTPNNISDYFIDDEELEGYNTPTWCPLKVEEYTFKFKEFSSKKIEELKSTTDDIELLNNKFEEYEDTTEYSENNDKLKVLYDKFQKILDSDDIDSEEFIKNEFDNSMKDFKSTIESLEDMSIKLNEQLNNLIK